MENSYFLKNQQAYFDDFEMAKSDLENVSK